MPTYPIFLSIVFVLRNQAENIEKILTDAKCDVEFLVSDYELIVVDNASQDNSVAVLKRLTRDNGLPNIQVFALTKEVSSDAATWAGLENALGDFVAVIDPMDDDISFLPKMLVSAVDGADVVFARNVRRPVQSPAYWVAYTVFNILYKWFNGIHLADQAPQYRLLNKRVINCILQHPQPAMSYRHLPATGGFARVNLEYCSLPKIFRPKRLGESIDRGARLLVSTTHAPMRLVTSLSLFGAGANVVYSVYVLGIAFLKDNVAEGWVSLSLQQSGMFLLISLVLLVLGEYILHMTSVSDEGPPYFLAQEFTSARMTRRERLNVDEVVSQPLPAASGMFRERVV